MMCPKCGEVFCVPAKCGPATVFHAPCDMALTLLLSADSWSEVSRAVVVFLREHNQLEVAIAAD